MSTPRPASEETATSRRPAFWPGLLLNLGLPGSGFSLLGRPWLHLAALFLTLLAWVLAWLLILYMGYSGLSTATRFSRPAETGLIILGLLMFVAPYGLLTWGYVRAFRRPAPGGLTWPRWLPVFLHLAALLLLVVPPLLGRPLEF